MVHRLVHLRLLPGLAEPFHGPCRFPYGGVYDEAIARRARAVRPAGSVNSAEIIVAGYHTAKSQARGFRPHLGGGISPGGEAPRPM
jgi:hypothetical protein